MVAFLELTKPRITQLVLLTAAAGFYLGAPAGVDLRLLVDTLVGVALVAAGTNAFNQVRERDVDARMRRTQGRPLPSGRVSPRAAGWFAGVISVTGVVYLAIAVNRLTAALAAVTLVSYVLLYTPLKRRTTLNTQAGRRRAARSGRPWRRCSGSCSCGSCRISSRSPGFTERTTAAAAW